MATTIDHLCVDHQVTVLSDFTDMMGVVLKEGERGILRRLSVDPIRLEIQIEIEREKTTSTLRFPLTASTGPRNGHMREFFELGDYIPSAGRVPVGPDSSVRSMREPPPENDPAPDNRPVWWRKHRNLDGSDRLEAIEQQIQREAQHIGAAASIAEMYAQRMRAFQRAGNEPRAAAAFKLATQWMWTYASQATSGGEGEALSHERDEFHAALVREFGYDPTEPSHSPGRPE